MMTIKTTFGLLVAVTIAILMLIIVLRYLVRAKTFGNDYDPLKHRSSAFFIGLAWSLAIVVLLFGITVRSEEYTYEIREADTDILDIEVVPYRTAEPKPKTVKVIPEVIDSIIFVEEDDIDTMVQKIDLVEMTLDSNTVISDDEITVLTPPTKKQPTPPLPPPPAKQDDDDEIYFGSLVEQMPRFPGCNDESLSSKELETCSQKKMLEYIYSKLKYPATARENGIEGMCVIQFEISKQGTVQNVRIAKDIGGGCGAVAKSLVNNMNDLPERWTPGKQRGRPVKVLYTLPVRFKLQ